MKEFHFLNIEENKIFKIGRKSDCDLVLKSFYVSRLHATLQFKNGDWIFENKSETSQTFCNGKEIQKRILKDNDLLLIGTEFLSVSLKQKKLSLFHIQSENKKPYSLSEKKWLTIGRKACDILIENLRAPDFFAKIQKEENLKIQFQKKCKTPDNKKIKELKLQNDKEYRLPFCRIKCNGQFLFSENHKPGFSVEVENLNVFSKKKQLLKNIQFTLSEGEILSIIGRSGQGKSTLLKAIAGNYKLDKSANIRIQNVPYNHKEIRKNISFLEQDFTLRNTLTVSETLYYFAKLHLNKGITKKEIESLIDSFLELLSLEKTKNTLVEKLSGGEKQRLALAKALILSPGLILLDEPLSGLDPVNAKHLCTHLKRLSLLGYTIILTTHNYEALEIADKILVIHEGSSAFFGTKQNAFAYFKTKSPAEMLSCLDKNAYADFIRSAYFFKSEVSEEYPEILFQNTETKNSFFIYSRMFYKKIFRDKKKFLTLISEPFIIGFLFAETFSQNSSCILIAFALMLSAIWFSLSLTIREFVAEKKIQQQEIRLGKSSFSILNASLFNISFVSFLQTLICFFCLKVATELSVSLPQLFIALLSCIVPSVTLGLFVSVTSENTGQANAFLPLLIIPQLLLAGALIPFDQMLFFGDLLSYGLAARYNLECLKDLFIKGTFDFFFILIPFGISFLFYIITNFFLQKIGKAS